jgi:hypothetical protein
MSAWIVSKQHIHAMVYLASQGPSDSDGYSWTWKNMDGTWAPWEYNVRAKEGARRVEVPRDDSNGELTRLGAMLWSENYRSVNYRYSERSRRPSYTYSEPIRKPTCAEALSIIHCYSYQTCEHKAWRTSEAKQFCDALEASITHCVPGYDAAPWGWDYK